MTDSHTARTTAPPPPDPLSVLLSALTPVEDKAAAYLGDTYVLECVDQLRRLRIDPAAFASRHSLLLLTPGAIVARAVDPTLKWLSGNGFRVVDAEAVPLNRHLVRALWRYTWHTASPERRRLTDLLAGISEALLLVVTGPDGDLPAPVRLADGSGPGDPTQRRPGQLRYLLGRRRTVLDPVHTPEDPADVVRELAVFFPETRRAEVISRAYTGADSAETARNLADALYARTPCRSFDETVALDRILRDLDRVGAPAPADFDAGSAGARAAMLTRALASGLDIDAWSAIVLGAEVLPMGAEPGPQALRP
ncbi:nucleoside-diphosphate kinase [Nocardia sienata]|uniref:nucleoside-diphosphate kinase n=1 Tax=Nocardia sienata TaxID=248552 RepID=UPI0007A4088B|nr:nucleoside-diphosphate kinase [Nocardia sienata]